jgi:hypothetical protein
LPAIVDINRGEVIRVDDTGILPNVVTATMQPVSRRAGDTGS